jgi:hypothetical protein
LAITIKKGKAACEASETLAGRSIANRVTDTKEKENIKKITSLPTV